MNDGLKKQQRNAILGVLDQHPKIERAVLFGSRAMGTFTPTSDIDIALYGDLTLRDLAKIADELEQLSIPYTVDLVRMKTVTSPELLAHIKEHGSDWKIGGRGMASERRYIPASEFCSSVRDGTHDSPKPVENGHKLVTSRHLTTGRLDLSDAYLISKEDFEAINKRSKVDRWDVLISMIGTVGEPCLIKEDPDFAIKNIGLFKTKSEADGKWLYYFLRSNEAQQSIREQSRGTTQQYIPLGALRSFPILVCDDPKEQKAIAEVLGALDDKIELNRRMNATLEAMARALFQSWFVDFAPVRAKLDGRQPEGMDADTAALFPESFQDSETGLIPKGWEVVSLEALASIRGGKQLPTEDCLPAGKFEVFGANGIMGYTTESTHDGFVIAFGRVGAYCGSIHWSLDGAWINNNASAVVPLQWPDFVLQTMLNIDFNSMRTGSAQPFIPNSSLASAKVLRPKPEIAEAFCRVVEPLRRQQADNDKQSRSLATLRDTLLPKLLSGEVPSPVTN